MRDIENLKKRLSDERKLKKIAIHKVDDLLSQVRASDIFLQFLIQIKLNASVPFQLLGLRIWDSFCYQSEYVFVCFNGVFFVIFNQGTDLIW